jgi:hypothetical protein
MPWWGGGNGANPAAEADYFKRVIAAGDVTPYNGLFFNDPANDRSKRTWYDQTGQVVSGFGQGGPAGPYEGGGQGGMGGGIEQLMNDMALQRISKTFNWQAGAIPEIKSFAGGGYMWSGDKGAFDAPARHMRMTIPGMVQGMVRGGGGGGGAAVESPAAQLIKGLTPEEIMRRKGIKRKPNKSQGGTLPTPSYPGGGGTPTNIGQLVEAY